MKTSNAEAMQSTSLSKIHLLGKIIGIEKQHVKNPNFSGGIETAQKYKPQARTSCTKPEYVRVLFHEWKALPRTSTAFQTQTEISFHLVGWACSTVGYFISIACTARKIAFMKAYLSPVNSALLLLKGRTSHSADLM